MSPTPPTMEWSLHILSPMGASVSVVDHDTDPNPIDGTPVCVVDACGRTLELRFIAKQSILGITPRQIIQFFAAPTATLVGAGVVVTCPPTDSPGAGPADQDSDALQRISCVGLEQLLKDSVVGVLAFDSVTDVSTIAYQICDRFAHPALVVTEGNFPTAGFSLGSWYAPYTTVYDALEGLLKQVPGGGCFYVNGDREIIWEPAAQSIPM